MARTIYPVNTMADGDVAFALSLGALQADINTLGVAAAEAVVQAILRSARLAKSLGGVPALAGWSRMSIWLFLLAVRFLAPLFAQTAQPSAPPVRVPTHADILRGAYGPDRANNDLLYYHLDLRVDPDKKTIAGKNTIRFKMLEDGNRIQIDLRDIYHIDKILFDTTELKYERDADSVFISFPQTLKKGETYSIDFYYSGTPTPIGRFGSLVFQESGNGRPWVIHRLRGNKNWHVVALQKSQWKDIKVDNLDISVSVPNGLTDVSNGRFAGKTDLGDGYTRWDWHVSYPINAYSVSMNCLATYTHFVHRRQAG